MVEVWNAAGAKDITYSGQISHSRLAAELYLLQMDHVLRKGKQRSCVNALGLGARRGWKIEASPEWQSEYSPSVLSRIQDLTSFESSRVGARSALVKFRRQIRDSDL